LLLEVDPARLAQVVANLLTNASKYSDPGKTVHIDAERAGSVVRLRVRDEGVGIPAEILGAVFEIFFQPPQASDRAKGGLGLGLAIVRSLVELHGGRVWAVSDGPALGSEFCIELPLAPGAEELESGSVSVPGLTQVHREGNQAAGRRVLVVDDNEDAAQSIADVLCDLGHEVKTAFDGVHALKIVRTFKPEICLLDIGLPVMDGYELARRLQQSNDLPAGARLFAVTGYGQDADLRRTADAGFDGHLIKPVTFDDLRGALAS
jgi:CheY-like chemotaxis protein